MNFSVKTNYYSNPPHKMKFSSSPLYNNKFSTVPANFRTAPNQSPPLLNKQNLRSRVAFREKIDLYNRTGRQINHHSSKRSPVAPAPPLKNEYSAQPRNFNLKNGGMTEARSEK
jgi:hypothetical protein